MQCLGKNNFGFSIVDGVFEHAHNPVVLLLDYRDPLTLIRMAIQKMRSRVAGSHI
jgi:hypothetical protein